MSSPATASLSLQATGCLFAGRLSAKDEQSLMLENANVAAYVLGDRSEAEGFLWRTLEKALAR